MRFKELLNKIFKKTTVVVTDTSFKIRKISELNDAEKSILRQQYQNLKKDLNDEYIKIQAIHKANVEKINNICPKCNSTNVNNRIKRIEGEIHGSVSGFCSTINGKIDGKLDTNPINKCNDCQNEWYLAINDSRDGYTSLEDLARNISRFMSNADDVYNQDIKFNPDSIKENYLTEEDKRNAKIAELSDNWNAKQIKKYFGKYSIELIQYVFNEEGDYKSSTSFYYWNKGDKSLLVSLLNIPSITT